MSKAPLGLSKEITQPVQFEDTKEVESEVKNMLMQATNKVNAEEQGDSQMLKMKKHKKGVKQMNV